MIELRFAEDLYDGFAVDEAAKIYGAHGSIELSRADGAYVVRVHAHEGVDDRTLAAELANYALGLTIDKAHGAAGAS